MSSDIIEPAAGPHSPDRRPPDSDPRAEADGAPPPAPPGALTTTSGDELSVVLSASLAQPRPDPLLGEFVAEEEAPPPAFPGDAPFLGPWPRDDDAGPREEPPRAEGQEPTAVESVVAAAEGERPAPIPDVAVNPAPIGSLGADMLLTTSEADVTPPPMIGPLPPPEYVTPRSADGLGLLASIANPAPIEVAGPSEPAGSFDAFPAVSLSPSVPSSASSAATRPAGGADEEEDEEYDDEPPRWMAWVLPLLVSYASAVTIGLVWVLWTGRTLRDNGEDFLPPADTRPDPGKHAGSSRKLEPPTPIPRGQITALGKPVRLGQIEVTPLDISVGTVKLQRTFNPSEKKDGGADALRLRLRLRNTSQDTVLFPLDEAFLRERERETLDSFIETGAGEPIEMYPLAVSSEWGVVGQEFLELKPGKSYETLVVSAPEALARKAPEMTWRVRLRIDVNQTGVIGVKFREADIKKGS